MPPARPPVPPERFVYALAADDISTSTGTGPRPRAHKQLGVWYGNDTYQGMILSFFKTASDARTSFGSLASLYGGTLVRNVVATWDQKAKPGRSVREAVFGCLRAKAVGGSATSQPPPAASLATFAGAWGGHTRELSITSGGRGSESTDDGCCMRVYDMTFQIVSVNGTLTRATAVFRVTSFKRHGREVRDVRAGDVGKLLLRDGIVTNSLTGVYFCSDPAWGATGVCGA